MNHLRVRSKLIAAFGGVLVVMLVLVGFAVTLLSEGNTNFESYVNGVHARSLMAARVRAAVDLRAISARNLVLVTRPEDLALERERVGRAHADATESIAQLIQMARMEDVSEEARRLIADMAEVEKAYAPVALDIVDLALGGRQAEAIRRMNDDCRPLLDKLIQASDAYARFITERASEHVTEARAAYGFHRALFIGGCLGAALLAVITGVLIERSLHHDLGAEPAELRELMGRVADGDLTSPIAAMSGHGDSVLSAVSRMQTGLIRMVAHVRQGAEEVSQASKTISQGNQELSSRTEGQADSLEQTASSMEQFGSTVRQNADNARQANELAQNASAIAQHGGEVVGRVVATMQGINDSSRQIADIIGVIDGIAFQTNILALNAAVEAARAGEAGRGFAVVASEVRGLANRSSEAAKAIKTLITDSVDRVDQGSMLVEAAGKTMADIVAGIGRVTLVVGEISVASQEQRQGVARVGDAVGHMDRTTQENANMVEEMASAAESLNAKACALVRSVATFKLPDTTRALHRPGTDAGSVAGQAMA